MNKVLFITPLLWNGGAERVVSILSNSLNQKGVEVGIFVYKPSEYDYFVSPEVKRYTFPFSWQDIKGNRLSVIFKRLKVLRQTIRDFQPDVCIPFLDIALIDTWAASIGLGVPYISTCRNTPEIGTFFHEVIKKIAFSRSKALFLQTEEQRQFFSKRLLKKSFVVSNPINERFLTAGENRIYNNVIKKIISCGRLDNEQKNYEILIKAVSIVHENYQNVTLDIYGCGPDEGLLQDLIKRLDAQDYIKLRGYVPDTLEVLKEADLFVLTSNYEGQPNALMEAMAVGVPVCSTDCPTGPSGLIGNDCERGYLVPVNDIPALVKAINNTIVNADVAKEKAIKARLFMKANYSPDFISNKLQDEIYRVTGL